MWPDRLAFSIRFLRTVEPIMQGHMDYFVARMKEISMDRNIIGIPLARSTNWLAMDNWSCGHREWMEGHEGQVCSGYY
ncbi:hypothetical protein CC80DRAFT_490134 [Byssothecium circinans]|uniref:Uncharacterized protein n=1 Tax=Byssothecium circinans TaxID=147558 RepID=A0A6A5U498_9PLEO|nr:hypothetical protein CC80DRAFT_490134 [Byssothecium circinans]